MTQLSGSRKAVFLDRDGVVNVDYGYVHHIDNFHFISGVFDACRKFTNLGYKIFIVTNQAGIARGYYSTHQFELLTEWMIRQFSAERVYISKVYHCPHHPQYSGACYCRKPAPGMILSAQKEFSINLEKSIMVGDKATDILAARNAGVGRAILLAPNYQNQDNVVTTNSVFTSLKAFSTALRE